MTNFERISIVGNGLSAWMMTAFMAKQLQSTKTKITLYLGVEAEVSASLQSPLPLINDFLSALGISSEILKRDERFHPKLGVAYLFDAKAPFFHVWGQYGAPIGVVEFHQVVMRYLQLDQSLDLNRLSIGAASVLSGRFQCPEANSNSIFATYESSWSFETETFIALLRSISESMGVEVNTEKISTVEIGERCYVRSESQNIYSSDYVISTVPGLIKGGQGVSSWFDSLPFEMQTRSKTKNALSVLVNKVKAIDGVSWLSETTHRKLAELNIYRFAQHDSGNVYMHEKPRALKYLNFGPAMAKMYSPLFTAIDLNLIAVKFLLRYFPSPSDGGALVTEFNNAINYACANLRDVTQLCLSELFAVNRSEKFKFVLSPLAEYKINLFRCRGRYPLLEHEFFKIEWQIWLLLGLGFKSENVEPMVSLLDDDLIREHVAKVARSVVETLPSVPLVE